MDMDKTTDYYVAQRKAYSRQYYLDNKARIQAYNSNYYWSHKQPKADEDEIDVVMRKQHLQFTRERLARSSC